MELTMLFVIVLMYYFFSNLYHIKHFLADFPLQTEYMLGKFKGNFDWVKPLMAHAGVHALFTFIILTVFAPWLSWLMIIFLSLLDMTIHFMMDRIKASPGMLGSFTALAKSEYANATSQEKKSNKYFWLSLGLDQMIHGLTHELIIFITILMFILGLV